jgi:hypothetical protein
MLSPGIPRPPRQLRGHEPIVGYFVKGFSHGIASYEAVHERWRGLPRECLAVRHRGVTPAAKRHQNNPAKGGI